MVFYCASCITRWRSMGKINSWRTKILTTVSADRRLFRVPSDYDLWTNFKHVKTILNSLPLTPVSADPDDMRVLIPLCIFEW